MIKIRLINLRSFKNTRITILFEKYEGIYLWDYFKNKSEILIKYDSKYLLSLNESEIYDINNQLKKSMKHLNVKLIQKL